MVTTSGIIIAVFLSLAIAGIIIIAVIFGLQDEYFKKKRCFSKELYDTIPKEKRTKWEKIYLRANKRLLCKPGQTSEPNA